MSIPQLAVNHCLTSKAPFTFTEDFIACPIQTCFEKRPSYSLFDEAKDFLSKAILTRVIGATTSFFAALDAMHFLGKALHKSAIYALSKPSDTSVENPISKQDILDDLKQAAMFGLATIIGSIVGVIYPSIYCSSNFRSYKVQELWSKALEADTFKQVWKTASISDKRVFTHLLDIETSDKGEEARASLVNIIYKDIKEKSSDDYWASEEDKNITVTSWPKQSDATYYHATRDVDSLRQILTSGEVEVRRQGIYKGAFVSTQPEKIYGSYVVVFKRNIERMADIEHRFRNDRAGYLCYWAGFKQNIPVNPQTVAKILLIEHNTWQDPAHETPEEMAQNIKQWTGQDIEVKYYDEDIHDGVNNKHIVPREWLETSA